MGSCPGCSGARSWNCRSGVACPPSVRSRTTGPVVIDPGGSHQDRLENVRDDFIPNVSGWWDKRLDKRASFHPTLQHNTPREGSRVVSQPARDYRLATLNAQVQSENASWKSTRGNEVEQLCKEGQLDRALEVLLGMDQQNATYLVPLSRCVLKACTQRKAVSQARRVYAHLVKHGLESTGGLGDSLVQTLVKCGSLKDALNVFKSLRKRSVVSWTAVISGCTQAGQCHEALRLYQCMQEEGVEPNAYTFVSLLKACGLVGNLEEGKRIHAEAVSYGCETNLFIQTCLVNMYGKCGSTMDARQVFDGLPHKDVVSWNVMLASYTQQSLVDEALQLYRQMQQEGVSSNDWTFVTALQACCMFAESEVCNNVNGRVMKVGALTVGREIHADARKKGYDSDVYVGSTLIALYGKCGSRSDACHVFEGLSQQNVVSWTAMFGAHVGQGEEDSVFQLYRQMQQDRVSPDARTFVSALQACGMLAEKEVGAMVNGQCTKLRSLAMGKLLHADARRRGHDADVFVASTLMSLYSKCGSIVDTKHVFDGLYQPSVVSWNAMLTAYVQQEQAGKALQLYEKMQAEGLAVSSRTFVSALQVCGILADEEEPTMVNGRPTKSSSLDKGMAIHADVCRKGYDSDAFVGTALVCMYGKCGSIADAENVFDCFSQADVVLCTAMLAAYVENDLGREALQMYEQIRDEGGNWNERTLVTALQACGMVAEDEEGVMVCGQPTKVECLEKGKAMHADALKMGYELDVFVGNTLVSMYGKCGSLEDAQHVFHGLSNQDTVSWNAMLMAWVAHGEEGKAMELYIQMQQGDVSSDARTFISAIQVCGMLADKELDVQLCGRSIKPKGLEMGKAVHTEVRRKGHGMDVFVASALLGMYEKCGSIWDAQDVFDVLCKRDVVAWTAILAAYVEECQAEKALQLYREMIEEERVSPDAQTFVCAIQACCLLADEEAPVVIDAVPTKVKSLGTGRAIHAGVCEKGYIADVFVASTLITMYGKCGSIKDAESVFAGLSHCDRVAWTVMLTAYAEHGQVDKVLQLYGQMHEAGIRPDEVALVCILQVCGNTGSLGILRQIHAALGSQLSPVVANTLISAYGRCCSMADARNVFDALQPPDVVSWTALIAAHARQGECMLSLSLYEEMQQAGVKPDGVTFLALICSCSHAGQVDKGVHFFESMTREHGITPAMAHYVSMVDLLGRAGQFTEVEDLLSAMPMLPNGSLWLCLLGACMKHHKVVLARQAFDCAVRLQPKNAAIYLSMWNIYARAGLWDCAQEVTRLRQKEGAWKYPGQSWIVYEHKVHCFLAGDGKGPQNKHVRDFLTEASSKLNGAGRAY